MAQLSFCDIFSHFIIFISISKFDSMEDRIEFQMPQLQQSLLGIQAPQLPVSDKIFFQAYQNCKLSITMQCIYAGLLLTVTPYFIFTIPFSKLQLYLIYLFLIEIFQFYYYNTIRLVLRSAKVYYLLAGRTQHLMHMSANHLPPQIIVAEPRYLQQQYDFREPYDTDHQRKMKNLSFQIHHILANSSPPIRIMYKLQFLFYQIAHAFALLLLLTYDFTNQAAIKKLLTVIVLVGTYQYLEFYLLLIFLLIVLPYYSLKNAYNYAVLKYRAYKLQKTLQSERFSQKLAGDKECKICLMPYEQSDSIIVLKCNELHNFHAGCIREWAKNSVTCPLCRANLCQM